MKFYRDVVGLPLKFQSPGWSEFATGETSLGLHPASEKNPAGKLEMGFNVPDIQKFHDEMRAKGAMFSMPPKKRDFGGDAGAVRRFRRRRRQRQRGVNANLLRHTPAPRRPTPWAGRGSSRGGCEFSDLAV